MKVINGKQMFTFEEVMDKLGITNDDNDLAICENDRYFANPKDMARLGAEIIRLKDRVEFLERKLDKSKAPKTGYSESTLEYPNGKKQRKSNKGLAPGFKRPKEWKKPGQYKR